MKAIIDGKLYDTETAKKIVEQDAYKVFMTKNGAFFVYDAIDRKIKLVEEENVKKYLGECFPSLYIKLFGEVEEG